jgi:hypothetical protein
VSTGTAVIPWPSRRLRHFERVSALGERTALSNRKRRRQLSERYVHARLRALRALAQLGESTIELGSVQRLGR